MMTSSRLYNLNENFLDSWCPSMAYVLGFWFADGYMRHDKSYRIVFASNDKQILEDINLALQANSPIRITKRDKAWRLVYHSRHMYEQLGKLGGIKNKSKTIAFPKIPKKYAADFIRGYFDGDGSVFWQSYKSTKNGKIYTDLRSNFTSGSLKFLKELMHFLHHELGLVEKKIGVYNEGRSLKLGYGTKDTIKLLKFMYYPNFPIALQRKAKFASVV